MGFYTTVLVVLLMEVANAEAMRTTCLSPVRPDFFVSDKVPE